MSKSHHRTKRLKEDSGSHSVAFFWIASIALFVAVFGLFSISLTNGFINLDDASYVANNPRVQAGLQWQGFVWALGSHQANWHPVTWLSHMLDCQLFGLKPWGHHSTNVFLHSANSVLLFWFFYKVAEGFGRSLFVASLFGLHPLHVESVAWVAERKDVLSTFFWILTLLTYSSWAQRKSKTGSKKRRFYVLSLIFFACGLMSKPMLVTTPLLLILLDYWPLRRVADIRWKAVHPLLVEKVPFFVMSAASCVVTFLVQQSGGAVMSVVSVPIGVRIENSVVSYCRYLRKLVWPSDLAIYYPFTGSWQLWQVGASLIFLLTISAVVIVSRKRYRPAFVGWFWFLGTLLPVIGIIQVGSQAIADRYMYFPAIGIFILVTWGVSDFAHRRAAHHWILWSGGIVVAFCCAILTARQLRCWRDSETLFRHAAAVGYDCGFVELSLGGALMDRGAFDEALTHLSVAKRSSPDDASVPLNLAVLFDKMDRVDEALKEVEEAIQISPMLAKAHFFYGLLLEKAGRQEQAMGAYERAARLNRDLQLVRYNLGILFESVGRTEDAITQYRAELKLNPNFPEAFNNLGRALLAQQDRAAAAKQFREAIRIRPNFAEGHNNLGGVLYLEGKRDEAIVEFREALRLRPDYDDAKRNLKGAEAGNNPAK